MRAALAVAVGLGLTACTASKPRPQETYTDLGVTGDIRLAAYTSCEDALGGLRAATRTVVGPYGLGGDMLMADGKAAAAAPKAPGAAREDNSGAAASAPEHSTTNTHEVGVDEPDLVKTDGRRIVTVTGGILRVTSAADHKVTGQLALSDQQNNPYGGWTPAELLLSGDHALVLVKGGYGWLRGEIPDAGPADDSVVRGDRLVMVDLSGAPKITGTLTVDGGYLDARQVGSVARVVTRSAPRLKFPTLDTGGNDERTAANRAYLDTVPIEAWLPRYKLTVDGRTTDARVKCEDVRRPRSYTGTSMLTVFTVDLAKPALGTGDPVSIVADGQTVYGTGESLYVTNDQREWAYPNGGVAKRPSVVTDHTEVYKFDVTGGGRPRYIASGEVPGYLLNQYSLSEHGGNLRVATTSGQPWGGASPKSESAVYVLHPDGHDLREIEHVGGLGKGERIYSVRFVGPVGYVVTFRQTDPLYTLDLRDPAKPAVTGELKITGYSAYLHPAGDNRLIGVGQEASAQGRRTGTQVSLFDVSKPEAPALLARYQAPQAYSEAEFDPHAFLFWPKTGLLVVPLASHSSGPEPLVGALALGVSGSNITELATIKHDGYQAAIRRSLVIGDTLWTVSDQGLKANALSGLTQQAWVSFT